jgi:C_GCAxxG_C_C family probable redox protein
MASERYDRAKNEAMAGYLNPGSSHLNCAQAVLHCALRAIDQDVDLTSAANYLGGGVVRTGHICGALSGACVALGLRDLLDPARGPGSSPATFDWLQQLTRRFESQFGATTCKNLLGYDISTPEGFREAKRSQATKHCPDYVGWACDQLAEVLDGTSREDRQPHAST